MLPSQSKLLKTSPRSVGFAVLDLFNVIYLYLLLAFGGNAWRNSAIAIVAGLVWYRVDQHITHSGDVRFSFVL